MRERQKIERKNEREEEKGRQIVHPTAQTRQVRTNTIHAVTTEHQNTLTKTNQDKNRERDTGNRGDRPLIRETKRREIKKKEIERKKVL